MKGFQYCWRDTWHYAWNSADIIDMKKKKESLDYRRNNKRIKFRVIWYPCWIFLLFQYFNFLFLMYINSLKFIICVWSPNDLHRGLFRQQFTFCSFGTAHGAIALEYRAIYLMKVPCCLLSKWDGSLHNCIWDFWRAEQEKKKLWRASSFLILFLQPVVLYVEDQYRNKIGSVCL